VIFGIGPYIADYPEQVLLTGIVSGWCPQYVLFACPVRSNFHNCSLGVRLTETSWIPTAMLAVARVRIQKFFLQAFDPGTLWDEYGLDADIIVSSIDFSLLYNVLIIAKAIY
jgi:hypothetical protein